MLLLHRQYSGLSLYIMPIERDVFLDIFETCCFQLRVESIKTPKYFIYSFSFMALLLILIVIRFFFGLL